MILRKNALCSALVIALFVPCPPVAGGEGNRTARTEQEKKGPAIQFDSKLMNIGRVRAGVTVKHTFVYSNPGDEILKVTDIKTGCTCTVAGYFDAEVPPGKTGRIEVELDTATLKKRVARGIRVYTNVRKQPVVTLRILGEVWQPFRIKPSAAVFAFADPQKPKKQTVTLECLVPRKIRFTRASVDSEKFQVELKTQREGQRYQLVVHTVPPLLKASEKAVITLHTDDAEIPEVVVKATANVVQEVHAVPTQIRFPAELLGPVSRSFYVRHARKKPFKITGATCSDPRLTVEIEAEMEKAPIKMLGHKKRQKKAGQGYRIQVTAPAGFQVKPEGVTVTLSTDVASVPSLDVRVDQVSANLGTRNRKHFKPNARPPHEDKD